MARNLRVDIEPRCLTAEQAAAYVGVSVATFRAEVKAGLWPSGTPRGARGGKSTWDRRQIDTLLDQRSRLIAPANSNAQNPSDSWDERLNGKGKRA